MQTLVHNRIEIRIGIFCSFSNVTSFRNPLTNNAIVCQMQRTLQLARAMDFTKFRPFYLCLMNSLKINADFFGRVAQELKFEKADYEWE